MSHVFSETAELKAVFPEPVLPPKLCVECVNFDYESANGKVTPALRDVSLTIGESEFVAIVGPSGCGKSTLLNIMSGLLRPKSGKVMLDGSPSLGLTTKIGYLSQTDALLPWRTVLENVCLGLEIKGIPKSKRRETASELIQRVGLSGFENCFPCELSGGMRKRVAIIRILAMDPEILFMDEPFGALDVFTKETLQDDILRLWQATQKTIVFVTHDLTEAITLADRVIMMTARPSTIKKEYEVSLPRPRTAVETRFSSRFVDLQKAIWKDLMQEMENAGGIQNADSA